MANRKADKAEVQDETLTAATPETDKATEKQAADVWAEFLKTGHVRDGYAVNVRWPEKARKLKKG